MQHELNSGSRLKQPACHRILPVHRGWDRGGAGHDRRFIAHGFHLRLFQCEVQRPRLGASTEIGNIGEHRALEKAASCVKASMAGELVTETLDYDGGRQVTADIPPAQPEAVVFAGRTGSRHTRSSSSKTSGDGRSRATASRCRWNAPRCSVSHLVAGTLEPFFHENASRWAHGGVGVCVMKHRQSESSAGREGGLCA